MSELVLMQPTEVGTLSQREIGLKASIQLDDAQAYGKLWGVEFRKGEVKVILQSSNGLLFFTLEPNAILHVGR